MDGERPWSLLLTWTTWTRLKHPALRTVNYYITPILAVLLTLIISIPGYNINFTQEFGFAHQINGLLQILAPFFIGALAAISSFQRETLDEPMSGNPPTLGKIDDPITPTRREFFGYLFGYLAALSVVAYAAGAVAMTLGSSSTFKDVMKLLRAHEIILPFFKFLYCIAFVNLMLTTFIGLHFLIHYLPKKPSRAGTHLLPGVLPPLPRNDEHSLRVGAALGTNKRQKPRSSQI